MKTMFFSKIIISVMAIAVTNTASAYSVAKNNESLLNLKAIDATISNISNVKIELDLGKQGANPKWEVPQVKLPILFSKIRSLTPNLQSSEILRGLAYPNELYAGIILHFSSINGEQIPPIRIYKVEVSDNDAGVLYDNAHDLEYWLMGVDNTFNKRQIAFNNLPITSFSKCVELGNPLIDTTPRQCLLPNDDLYLDINEKATAQSLAIKDFDGCLENGKAIINTFPRRCIVAGGRVFTEPARLRHNIKGRVSTGSQTPAVPEGLLPNPPTD